QAVSFAGRRATIAVALVMALFAAAAAAAGVAATSATPQPDLGAAIRIGTPGSSPSLDLAKQGTATSVHPAVWDRLTQLDDRGRVVPMIATSWTTAKDAKSITFKLRKDVKFHDGTQLDATAVKASLDRAMTLPGSAVAALLDDVQSVDVVDRYTVRVNLKYGGG